MLERRLRIGGERGRPWLDVEVELRRGHAGSPAHPDPTHGADLALEWSVCLSGGGGNPAAYYELPDAVPADRLTHDGSADLAVATRLAFGNDHEGVRVEARIEPPARLTWFPIETVSNSEAGFERVYQGSSLLVRWRLPDTLDPHATFRLRFAVSERRDRALEEAELVDGPEA